MLPQNMKASIMDHKVAIELLANSVQIIDLASKRGAWTGADLTPIGQVREGLMRWHEEMLNAAEVVKPSANIMDMKDTKIGDTVTE